MNWYALGSFSWIASRRSQQLTSSFNTSVVLRANTSLTSRSGSAFFFEEGDGLDAEVEVEVAVASSVDSAPPARVLDAASSSSSPFWPLRRYSSSAVVGCTRYVSTYDTSSAPSPCPPYPSCSSCLDNSRCTLSMSVFQPPASGSCRIEPTIPAPSRTITPALFRANTF